MSWGYHQYRTAEEVQADNRHNFTFDSIRFKYENTKPIKGKRECLNIRPVGERGRSHERVIKVSDYEYYITCNSWARINKDGTHRDSHCRAITFLKDQWGSGESMVIHVPKSFVGQNAPSWLNSPSVFWFYHYNLPNNFAMHNHRGKKYVQYTKDDKTNYYPLFIGDLVFYKSETTAQYMPLQVHREFKRELDKDQTKKLREKINPLVNYINTMIDLVENETYKSGNPLQDIPEEVLFKQDPDESWFQLVEIYKRKIRDFSSTFDSNTGQWFEKTEHKKHLLNKKIYDNLYRKMKPFKITEVPIGSLTYDKFKNWE